MQSMVRQIEAVAQPALLLPRLDLVFVHFASWVTLVVHMSTYVNVCMTPVVLPWVRTIG